MSENRATDKGQGTKPSKNGKSFWSGAFIVGGVLCFVAFGAMLLMDWAAGIAFPEDTQRIEQRVDSPSQGATESSPSAPSAPSTSSTPSTAPSTSSTPSSSSTPSTSSTQSTPSSSGTESTPGTSSAPSAAEQSALGRDEGGVSEQTPSIAERESVESAEDARESEGTSDEVVELAESEEATASEKDQPVEIAVPETPVLRVRESSVNISGVISLYGYNISFEGTDGYAKAEYPSFITDEEVADFASFVYQRNPEILTGVYYTIPERGVIELTLPENVSLSDAEYALSVLLEDLESYIQINILKAVPKAPSISVKNQALI